MEDADGRNTAAIRVAVEVPDPAADHGGYVPGEAVVSVPARILRPGPPGQHDLVAGLAVGLNERQGLPMEGLGLLALALLLEFPADVVGDVDGDGVLRNGPASSPESGSPPDFWNLPADP